MPFKVGSQRCEKIQHSGGNNMIESLILIEGQNLNEETLRSISLGNAKQLVVGRVPGSGVILHVAADSPAYLGTALLDFAQIPGAKKVLTLAIQTPR
jgi:hypothetical protein